MRKTALIFGIIGISLALFGQSKLPYDEYPHRTYIYKISASEALSLVSNKDSLMSSYLHTLMHELYTYGDLYNVKKKLDAGHYLIAQLNEVQLNIEYYPVRTFEINIQNNDMDLIVEIMDQHGKVIPNADVLMKNKKVRYDKKLGAYIRKKNDRSGILTVHVDDEVHYIKIEKEINKSLAARRFNHIVFQTPLRWIANPVRMVLLTPRDIVRSVRQKQPVGALSSWIKPVGDVVKSIKRHQPYGWLQKAQRVLKPNKHRYIENNVLITDRPYYNFGDTIRFKAHFQKLREEQVLCPSEVTVQVNRKHFNLKNLAVNSSPGVYHGQFLLPDSLKSVNNSNVIVQVKPASTSRRASSSVQIKDVKHERSISFAHLTSDLNHIFGESKTLLFEIEDENGLYIPGSILELSIKPINFMQLNDDADSLFVPDEIYYLEERVYSRKHRVVLPDSIFSVPMRYMVRSKLITPDARSKSLSFYINMSLPNVVEILHEKVGSDSMRLMFEDGRERDSVWLEISHPLLNRTFYKKTFLPKTIYINRGWSHINVVHHSGRKNIALRNFRPNEISVYSERNSDEIELLISNPDSIPCRYQIFKSDKSIESGFCYGTVHKLFSAKNKQAYCVHLEYTINGNIFDKNYNIVLDEERIITKLDLPDAVFPGQQVNLRVRVTDIDLNPMENMDLTLWANKKQFNQRAPSFPYRYRSVNKKNKSQESRKRINRFSKGDLTKNWVYYLKESDMASYGLDTFDYYKSRFPESRYYTHQRLLDDSTTQISPFIVKDGQLQHPWVIYLDNRPIYFGFLNHLRNNYSFHVTPGRHQLAFRLPGHEVVVKNLEVVQYHKNTFIIDFDKIRRDDDVTTKPMSLTQEERVKYRNYIQNIRLIGQKGLSYIRQGSTIFPENGPIGPILPSRYSIVYDDWVYPLQAEPNFYQIYQPTYHKLVSWEYEYPNQFPRKVRIHKKDRALTAAAMKLQHEALLRNKFNQRKVLMKSLDPPLGNDATLLLLLPFQDAFDTHLTILIDASNTMKFNVYPGGISRFDNIKPGMYNVLFVARDTTVQATNLLNVKPNCTSIYRPELKDKFYDRELNTIFSLKQISNLLSIEQVINNTFKFIRQLNDSISNHSYDHIIGQVLDEFGEPLPFADVLIKGSSQGTQTDINGRFELPVQQFPVDLSVSYVGYSVQELNNVIGPYIDIYLTEGINLEEVVIVEYKVPQIEFDNTTSGGVLTAEDIQNLPTKNINALASLTAGLTGLGSRSSGVDYFLDGIRENGKLPAQAEIAQILSTSMKIEHQHIRSLYDLDNTTGIDNKFNTMELAEFSGTRDDFRDVAWWIPNALTNEHGVFEQEVKMPSDIANWDTHTVGIIDGKLQYQASHLKSYKPLAAEMQLPRFAVLGDQVSIRGIISNYTNQSYSGNLHFITNETDTMVAPLLIDRVHQESHLINVDSTQELDVVFAVHLDSVQFMDGERRNIPVIPQGFKKTTGLFIPLFGDTSLIMEKLADDKSSMLRIMTRNKQILHQAIVNIKNYKHKCNEQLSSVLLALIYSLEFGIEDEEAGLAKIKKISNELLSRLKGKNGWSWWNSTNPEAWVSQHILQVIRLAVQLSYIDDLPPINYDYYKINLDKNPNPNQLQDLKILKQAEVAVDFAHYFEKLDTLTSQTAAWYLEYAHFKQSVGFPFDTSVIEQFQSQTEYGEIYFTDTTRYHWSSWRRGQVYHYQVPTSTYSTSLYGFLLCREINYPTYKLDRMRAYLLNHLRQYHRRNTYETMLAVQALLDEKNNQPTNIKARFNKRNHQFIDTMAAIKIALPQSITIEKSGQDLALISLTQEEWIRDPKPTSNNLTVTTSFRGLSADTVLFNRSDEFNYVVTINNHEKLDYTHIEVPIPAGCSYAAEPQTQYRESNRAYWKDRANIYLRTLEPGIHTFTIPLQARNSGLYHVNPVKVENMYFPVRASHNAGKVMRIVD